MATYTITPRAKKYWITAVGDSGERKQVEVYTTEAAALQRLQDLVRKAETVKPVDRFGRYRPRVWPA
jgi:hypothetical protein